MTRLGAFSRGPTWKVLQRRADAIRVKGMGELFATIVLDADRDLALATHIEATSEQSLRVALSEAETVPHGGVKPGLPGAVLCNRELAPGVARLLSERGVRVQKRESSDDDEDILDSLVSHMTGAARRRDSPCLRTGASSTPPRESSSSARSGPVGPITFTFISP